MIGSHHSHYRILDRIDRGGMGVVWKAEDVKLDRPAVLKFLPSALCDDEAAKKRFVLEAKAASALDHPNICTIYEIGETDEGQLFIAMAYYEGETLHQKISRGPLAVDEAMAYVRQIAAALAKSHQHGIIHRDVKPANVFITHEGQVKLLDFGLAKMLGEGVTLTGLAQGTPAYMAPERIRNEKAGPQTDLWSLGVVFYEALAGRPPFSGGTVAAVIRTVHTAEPDDLHTVRPDLPGELAGIVHKLLAKNPIKRFADCEELLRALEPLSTLEPLSATAARGKPLLAPAAVRRFPGRGSTPRRRMALALVVLLIVAALLLTGWWLERAPSSSRTPPPSLPPASALPEGKTLAILFVDTSGTDPALEWMRTGITERMAAGLSGLPNIRVLNTELVEQIVQELGGAGVLEDSADAARRVAQRVLADQVLVGRVVQEGDTLHIAIRLEDAVSGRVLSEQQVDVEGGENLLSRIDDLSLGIRQRLELPRSAAGDPDADIDQVTTPSLEAWVQYSQGMKLHFAFQESAAAELFQKAVQIDPQFAMAWVKLAVVSRNLNRPESGQYAAKAKALAERLLPRERHYIDGMLLSYDTRQWPAAIESFRHALEIDPGHFAARQNLLVLHAVLERYGEAIAHGEVLRRNLAPSSGFWALLAESHAGRGELESAEAVLHEHLARDGESFAGHCALGRLYQRWGKLERALESFATAESIQPATAVNLHGLCTSFLLQERWQEALDVAAAREAESGASLRATAGQCRILVALYHGRSAEALSLAEELIRTLPPLNAAGLRLLAGKIHLHRGDHEAARQEALELLAFGLGSPVAGQALFLQARAELGLGNPARARELADELQVLARQISGAPELRRHRHLIGRIELATGQSEEAVRELEAAVSSLPPRGIRTPLHEPEHAPLWVSLAAAYRTTGERTRELEILETLLASTEERVVYPIEYVRSLYRLAEAYRASGDDEQARALLRRFQDLWRHGDLNREWVEEPL